MDRTDKPYCSSRLVLVQLDHVAGDIVASAIDRICALGVKNVNLVPSLTKKGRPGYLLFIDVPEGLIDHVAEVLSMDLGVLGMRVLDGEHRTFPFRCVDQEVDICVGDNVIHLNVPVKLVGAGEKGVLASVEHDFCVQLRTRLHQDHDIDVPLTVLKSSVVAAVAAVVENPRGAAPSKTVNPGREDKED